MSWQRQRVESARCLFLEPGFKVPGPQAGLREAASYSDENTNSATLGPNTLIPISSKRFRAICQVAGWLLVAGIVAVTVSPITERPASGFAPGFERAAAFLTMGLLFGLGYPGRWLLTLCMVPAGAFAIEALQFLTPDRHPAFADALVKTGGGTIGILVGLAMQRRFQRALQ